MTLLRSVLWLLLGRWFYNIISLISFPIIVSQLTASEYGVFAISSTLLIFTEVFFAEAVENTVVRQPGDRPTVAATGMWVSLFYSFLFASIFYLAAKPISSFYENPLYGQIVEAISGLVILQGLAVIPRALFLRSGRPRQLALCLSLGNLVGAALAITAVFHGFGVWSLLVQQASLQLAVLVLGCSMTGFLPSLRINWTIARSMGRFTWFSLWSSVFNISSNRLDIILLSATFDERISGIYGLAKRLIQILQDLVASSFDKVFLSLHARNKALGSTGGTGTLYRQSVVAQSVLVFPSFAGFALVAHQLIPMIFGEEWSYAAPLIVLMALGGIFRSLVTIERADQFAEGLVGRLLWVRLIEFVISIIIIFPAVRWGPAAVAAAFSLRYVISYILVLSSYGQTPGYLLQKLARLLRWQLPILTATAVMIASVLAARTMLNLQGMAGLVSEVGLGATAYVTVLLILRGSWWDSALGRDTERRA